MRLMRTIRIILTFTLITLFIASNISVYANQMIQHTTSQIMPQNTNFEINVNGTKYAIEAPLDPVSAPITVKIIADGEVIFQQITNKESMVVHDGIDHRVTSDAIDFRVTHDAIDHRVLEVSQSGIVIFNQEI